MMDGRPHSEDARKLIHILFGGCAFLLRYLAWHEAALIAIGALAFNIAIMPRVGSVIYRPADRTRPYAHGIVLYPVAVLGLILCFPYRLDIAAAAWGILAFGDGMASVVGRRWGRRRIPWNRDKSIEGSAALFLFGGAAGAFLAWWCRPAVIPPPFLWFSLAVPFIAALVAAFAETIPVRLDDNILVPGSAAGVLWVFSLMSEDLIRSFGAHSGTKILIAAAVNGIAAWIGCGLRTVTKTGAIAGAAIGTAIAAAAGWNGWTLLLLTFLAAAISSRMGVHRKTLLGIAEERGGRRGAGNALANTGLAAVAAIMAALTNSTESAMIAFAAALTASGSDTIASEIGKAWGHRTYLITNLRPVRPGTSGAISLEGSAAGLLGAFALAGSAVALDVIPAWTLGPVVAGATLGAFVESMLGATLEARGILNNDLLNFFNTAIAAAAALTIAGLVG
jgi:uncharacterized protein (TIGR00297 family)